MNTNYLVSVIIPVFNAAKFLDQTLKSVANQSYNNIEVIIIDDHSNDKSWEIIQYFCTQDLRFKAFKNKNKGAASARNFGTKQSNGYFIQYLDADDILHENKIKHQIDYYIQKKLNPSVLIGCNWIRFSKNIENTLRKGDSEPLEEEDFDNKEWLLQRRDMALHAWLFTKEIIFNHQIYWNEELTRNDDGDFLYRILYHIEKVIILPDILVYYRTENYSSLSKGLDYKSMNSWIISAKTYKSIVVNLYGDEGKLAADKFLYFLYYTALFRHSDLAKKALKEISNKKKVQNIGDNFVFKIAKIIGIKNAKRVRILLNWLRRLQHA